MWCAILVAGVTTLFVLLSLLGTTFMGITPSALLDTVLFAAIAYGLYKYSRFAAVAGFVLFLVEKIYAFVKTGSVLGVGVLGIIILFGFLNGMRGAFAHHRLLAAAAAQNAPPLEVSSHV